MPGFDFRSLFTEDPERQLVSGPGATSDWRIKPKSLLDEDADPRFPAFQQAWKQGAGLGDLFGPTPFKLQGTVAPSGGDNTRPDVAKVQTLLGRAGYLDLGQDGPSGYPNPNTDKAIRDFQKDNGLQVDGVLKPNGPTIAKLGGLLGGGAEPASKPSNIVEGEWDWMDKKRMPDLRPAPQPVDKPANNGWDALIRILNGDRPEMKPTPPRLPPSIPNGSDSPEEGGITGRLPRPQQNDPYPGHTINQEGINANQAYAEMLVRDTDPSQSARMLKRAIDDYGDQGRGDVADLLARFQKIDGGKAEDLRRELHKATGEMLPYRIAPLGEGFREPTEEEKIAAAPKSPFGSADGADRWAAANMAEALLGKGDYRDGAVEHFRGEIARDRSAAMPYLAAVHQAMGDKNPALAAKFATQMKAEGLTAAADPGTKTYASAQSGSENQQVAKMGDQKVWPEIGRDIVGGGGIAIGGAIGAGGAVRPETGNGDFVKPGPQGPAGKPSVGGSAPQGQQTTIAVPEAGKPPVLTGPDPSKPQPQQGTPPSLPPKPLPPLPPSTPQTPPVQGNSLPGKPAEPVKPEAPLETRTLKPHQQIDHAKGAPPHPSTQEGLGKTISDGELRSKVEKEKILTGKTTAIGKDGVVIDAGKGGAAAAQTEFEQDAKQLGVQIEDIPGMPGGKKYYDPKTGQSGSFRPSSTKEGRPTVETTFNGQNGEKFTVKRRH